MTEEELYDAELHAELKRRVLRMEATSDQHQELTRGSDALRESMASFAEVVSQRGIKSAYEYFGIRKSLLFVELLCVDFSARAAQRRLRQLKNERDMKKTQ